MGQGVVSKQNKLVRLERERFTVTQAPNHIPNPDDNWAKREKSMISALDYQRVLDFVTDAERQG